MLPPRAALVSVVLDATRDHVYVLGLRRAGSAPCACTLHLGSTVELALFAIPERDLTLLLVWREVAWVQGTALPNLDSHCLWQLGEMALAP